ncbi:MAG: hypothetical protein Q4C14_04890 [Bacillota bacterium]|nr:hypothetical protein [Bacillota bacterium]
MSKKICVFAIVCALIFTVPVCAFALPVTFGAKDVCPDSEGVNNESSIYCWTPYLLSEGSYPDIREFFNRFNITRVYQSISEIYFQQEETAAMVKRLADDGIETVALAGERAWGLAGSDLSPIKAYIDAVRDYNSGIGADAKIEKMALDVETFTYSAWKSDKTGYFKNYIRNMQEIYSHAREAGLEVVQVIPAYFDSIDEELFRVFVETCCDEISVMNYTKDTQVNEIAGEMALCRELGKKVETIFETMPYTDYYGVTEDNTYFYEGLDAVMEKRSIILQTYKYDKLSTSYHHFPTMYHVASGRYMAEIYAYTDSGDPSRNDLGQTYELDTVILYGDDGSVVKAGLYNPNLGQDYEENCYLAVGVMPGVKYTVAAGTDNYTVTNPEKIFSFGEGELIDYTSIRIKRG